LALADPDATRTVAALESREFQSSESDRISMDMALLSRSKTTTCNLSRG
jgi:hypothetical protein